MPVYEEEEFTQGNFDMLAATRVVNHSRHDVSLVAVDIVQGERRLKMIRDTARLAGQDGRVFRVPLTFLLQEGFASSEPLGVEVQMADGKWLKA